MKIRNYQYSQLLDGDSSVNSEVKFFEIFLKNTQKKAR